jgi:hypothetical protein
MLIPRFSSMVIICLALPSFASTLSVNETQELDFATMAVPSGTSTITVNTMGNASGTGNIIYGNTFNGTYSILSTGGSPPPTIEIDIASVTGGSGYSLSNFKGEYDGITINSFPATGLPTPNGVAKTLRIGATVTYSSAVNVGQFSPTFDIVVNYE